MHKFSEKRLLYKKPDEFPGAKEKPPTYQETATDIEKNSKSQIGEIGAECAESLTQTTASEIMIDLFGANYEEAKIEAGPKFMAFYESVEASLKEGWTYKGIKVLPNDIDVLWEKPNGEKGSLSLKEYVGEEKYEIIQTLLSPENKTAMAKEKERLLTPNQRARKFIEKTILPFIKKRRPKLKILRKYSDFWDSDMVKEELLPILEAGYEADKPYGFAPKPNGFILKGEDKKWPDQEFNFYRYDDNLDYIEKSTERNMEAFIANQLIPIIKKYRPYISNRQISESYMLREEVIPILYAGYAAKEPFKIRETHKGFVLSNRFELFNKHKFNFEEYDEDLNLRTAQTKRYETTPLSELNKLAESWEKFDIGPLPEGMAENMQSYISKVNIDDFVKHFPDAESIRPEREAIEEAQREYYSDETETWNDLKDRLLEEGGTYENMEDWENNFDSVAEKSGLPQDLSASLKETLGDAKQKIDNGEITTAADLHDFFAREGTDLEEKFRAYSNEAKRNEDYASIAGMDMMDEQIGVFADLLGAELED